MCCIREAGQVPYNRLPQDINVTYLSGAKLGSRVRVIGESLTAHEALRRVSRAHLPKTTPSGSFPAVTTPQEDAAALVGAWRSPMLSCAMRSQTR